MTFQDFLIFGYQLLGTCFVLGVATAVYDDDGDDDDDQSGGLLQPCYVTNQ